jgi:Tol biopolymer transport system component
VGRFGLLFVSSIVAVLVVEGVWLLGTHVPARAAFSGENGRLVYSRSSRGDLYTVAPDGTAPKRLTDNIIAEDPAWSTNGRIAFARYLRRGASEIYVKNTNTGRLRRLTDNSTYDLDPAWSPDGSKLAFERNNRIWVMNANGSAQKNLGLDTPVGWSFDPAWSPDGSELAFESDGEIWTAKSDGSGAETRLTDLWATEGKAAYAPDWSPDGSKIVFTAKEPGCCFLNDVWVVNADGSGLRNLTDSAGGVGEDHPVWSPEGNQIAYVRSSSRSGRVDIWTMNADGSSRLRIPNTSGGETPDWRALP